MNVSNKESFLALLGQAKKDISNIDISKTYGEAKDGTQIHYESFDNFSIFYGRYSKLHFHDRYYQIHYLSEGSIYLQLGEEVYSLKAPCFFLTPPSIPHGFYTEEDTHGHVLTIPQQFVWDLLRSIQQENNYFSPLCVELVPDSIEKEDMERILQRLVEEYHGNLAEKGAMLRLYAKILFISIYRIEKKNLNSNKKVFIKGGDIDLFNRFNLLIEQNFKKNWNVTDYLQYLCISESRLNTLCKKFSGLSPKQVIIERQLQEARHKLLFSQESISQIAYELGFNDPAYFSRYFQIRVGISPKKFRDRDHTSAN